MSFKRNSFFILFLLVVVISFFMMKIGENSKEVSQEVKEEIKEIEENFSKYVPDTSGFIEAKVNVELIMGDKAEITITAGCYMIKAVTDSFIADAIIKGQEKKIEFRPSIYDAIVDVFKSLGIEILGLKIVEMKNNTYIGQLILQQKERIIFLDIRPSDGVALAVRFGAPIYINETLAKTTGNKIC